MKSKEEIQSELDEKVNTLLGQHRGRVDITEITEHPEVTSIRAVHVKMSGGCQGCAGARATLKTIITECIKSFDSTVEFVIDDSNHEDKTNAFFKE